jgi:diadenylate cyclase
VRWGPGSMSTEPREDRQGRRPAALLGFPRSAAELDPRIDPTLLTAISRIAPGTPLRQGIDDIIRAREGALIVIGEPSELSFMFSGGIRLDHPFTPQLLYELAKMDGAIIVNTGIAKIAHANVQLMPDPTIPSSETGTRHRTAERVAKQTKALVISISQQRETVTLFIGQSRYQLDPIADVLAKTNQALATLETYRQRLDQVLTRLTALEFQNAVMLDDVVVVLQRAELTTRMADYIERACTELGSEGRLIRMQLEEQVSEVPAEKAAIVFDYHADGGADRVAEGLEGLAQLPYQELLEFELLAMLGYPATTNPSDYSVTPRGYRVLSHIPRLPENVIQRLVGELGGLEGIVRASQRDLEAVDGVGAVRAREIREGLRRLQEHNLVDRYLLL